MPLFQGLLIPEVRRSDRGVYQCVVYSIGEDGGEDLSSSVVGGRGGVGVGARGEEGGSESQDAAVLELGGEINERKPGFKGASLLSCSLFPC